VEVVLILLIAQIIPAQMQYARAHKIFGYGMKIVMKQGGDVLMHLTMIVVEV
jgi:hypothetical protein